MKNMEFKVGSVTIGGQHTVVIAEAGVNHLRDLSLAEELILSAAHAGVDIVKFQTYDAAKLTTKNAPRFWEWEGERDQAGSQYDSYSILATPEREFTESLVALCNKHGVEFMSTPFDIESASMLADIGCKAFKIASGDITNTPLLRHVAKQNLPIFLSTGASSIPEIRHAIEEIEKIADVPVCIMHCTLCYPTRARDANLSALLHLRDEFPGYILGFSDHTIGPAIPASSPLYGCKVIEKHYTTDNSLPDSADHWLSIDPKEMALMVEMLRQVEKAVGSGVKSLLECEHRTRANARRSLVANGPIKRGVKFTMENLTAKRPSGGVSPIYIDEIIGLTASRDIQDDEIIHPSDVLEDAEFKPIDNKELRKNKRP
jgi:N,N'-diacetyllegionaminate synthase